MTGITSLTDKDRIFTNLYGFQGADLKAAQARGDWDETADLMKRRPGRDHRGDQGHRACAAAAARASRPA